MRKANLPLLQPPLEESFGGMYRAHTVVVRLARGTWHRRYHGLKKNQRERNVPVVKRLKTFSYILKKAGGAHAPYFFEVMICPI